MKSALQAMRDLLNEDTRFPLEAYQFVREALQHAHEHLLDDGNDADPDSAMDDYPLLPNVSDDDDLTAGMIDDSLLDESHEDLEKLGDELLEEALAKQSAARQQGSVRPRHITGQQLCEACRLYAIDQYGYLARIVLESWGICCTGDFGELVYNLIRIGQMRKSDNDRREDFDDVYDFETAFKPQFEMAIDNDVV